MELETLLFSEADGVAEITLNRPKARNAINLDLAKELKSVAEHCAASDSIRAVLLTGAGPVFCAGGDLMHFAAAGDNLTEALDEMMSFYHPALEALANMDAPVIAAINGPVAGAGVGLVASCSLAIASEASSFTLAYGMAGLNPDGSTTFHLPRLIGMRRAEEMMLTNRTLTARDALNWGLISQVAAETEVLEKARATAARIAKGPTAAFGRTRRLLLASASNTLEDQLELEREYVLASTRTHDFKEGAQAFMERRPAAFVGK
ncbi:MAG: enoyl-CoA hydratase-related protein [Pseudomonadota bacterium]